MNGLLMSTYFSAFKLKWLYDNSLDVQAAASTDSVRFGTVDSWLLYVPTLTFIFTFLRTSLVG
jgi:glycerol kinase